MMTERQRMENRPILVKYPLKTALRAISLSNDLISSLGNTGKARS
jgi:hypothetical protein